MAKQRLLHVLAGTKEITHGEWSKRFLVRTHQAIWNYQHLKPGIVGLSLARCNELESLPEVLCVCWKLRQIFRNWSMFLKEQFLPWYSQRAKLHNCTHCVRLKRMVWTSKIVGPVVL